VFDYVVYTNRRCTVRRLKQTETSPFAVEAVEDKPAPYNCTRGIIAFEAGELEEDGIFALFSHLIRTGLAWSLQGSYGRMAVAFIKSGRISEKGEVL
jgi:hypothetical protein